MGVDSSVSVASSGVLADHMGGEISLFLEVEFKTVLIVSVCTGGLFSEGLLTNDTDCSSILVVVVEAVDAAVSFGFMKALCFFFHFLEARRFALNRAPLANADVSCFCIAMHSC